MCTYWKLLDGCIFLLYSLYFYLFETALGTYMLFWRMCIFQLSKFWARFHSEELINLNLTASDWCFSPLGIYIIYMAPMLFDCMDLSWWRSEDWNINKVGQVIDSVQDFWGANTHKWRHVKAHWTYTRTHISTETWTLQTILTQTSHCKLLTCRGLPDLLCL